jgi:hypothetical protein
MPKVAENNAIKMELSSFADSLIQQKPCKVGFEDGLKAVELAYWIMREIDEHQERISPNATFNNNQLLNNTPQI